MSDSPAVDHTKSYPWPTRPPRAKNAFKDLAADLQANLAAKPARDAAARAAAGPPQAFVRPVQSAAIAAAPTFSQTPIAPKEVKGG